MAALVPVERHPQGCVFCPAELLGLERDRNGDPLCQTCPHLRATSPQVHAYRAHPRAKGYVNVCLCGLWPLHHVHTGNRQTCTCDGCQ